MNKFKKQWNKFTGHPSPPLNIYWDEGVISSPVPKLQTRKDWEKYWKTYRPKAAILYSWSICYHSCSEKYARLGSVKPFSCSYPQESCALRQRLAQFGTESQGCSTNHKECVSGQQEGAGGFLMMGALQHLYPSLKCSLSLDVYQV